MSRLKLWLAGLSFVLLLGTPVAAHADVNDFIITSFDSDQTLTTQDRQGELRIVERIAVDFSDNNHGILRAIPDTYKGHSLQLHINSVQSDSGAPASYTTESVNGNTVLRIGDPNRTVTGAQSYTIDYTVRNVITFYGDHAELYWDVNGDQWRQPFARVHTALHLPQAPALQNAPACYAGSYGSTGGDCTATVSGNTVTIDTTRELIAGETLTYRARFNSGVFQPATWYERVGEYTKQLVGFGVPFVLISGIAVSYWWRFGRDPHGRGTIVPQYDAPDGLRPIYIGAITDFKVDNRDITATLIDLAIRRYIKIIETKQDRLLLKDTARYSIELLLADFTQLDPAERKLLTALFPVATVGTVYELKPSATALYAVAGMLRKDVKAVLVEKGYLRARRLSGPAITALLASVVVTAVLVIGLLIAEKSAAIVVGVIAGAAVVVACVLAFEARTAAGVAAKEHIEGLKRYLTVAEKDRLTKLQAPDAAYAAPNPEPVRTVELFEKLLPYAIVLGVENGWSKQFAELYTTPPDWYIGNWTTFNAVYFASSLNSGMASAVNSSFTAPSSSSGGSFSGGGGGGGGGGGW